jgi:hypothetical protein
MPIFTNNSTFPFHKFNLLDNREFDSYDDLKNFVFVDFPESTMTFENLLIHSIKQFENQHLFEIITIYSLRAIFNKSHKKISLKDGITSSSISNINDFLKLLNMRIDLNKINDYLEDLINENKGIQVYKTALISGIIRFTYKYLYVKFANLIYCNTEDEFTEVLDVIKYINKYTLYKSKFEEGKCDSFNYHPIKTFLHNYKKSFNTKDEIEIERINNEMLLYSDLKDSEKILNQLIEKNIIFDDSLSQTKQNRTLRPFFILITSVFFHREYINSKSDDHEVIEYFKKFRLRMKK